MERENIPDWQDQHHDYMQNELDSDSLFRFNSLSDNRNEKEYEDFFFLNGGCVSQEPKSNHNFAIQNELELQSHSDEFSMFGEPPAASDPPEHGGNQHPQATEAHASHGCDETCTCQETQEGAETEDSGIADQPIVIKVTREAQEQLFSSYEDLVNFSPTGLLEENEYCSCTKSKCVLMYCSCFRRGLPCSKLCGCVDCENRPEHYEKSALIRQQKLASGSSYYISSVDELFCTCRTSFCQKLYCPCKKNQRPCTHKCRCFSCKNDFGARQDRAKT